MPETESDITMEQIITPPKAMSRYRMQWGVQIPMRDGIHLNATIFFPGGVSLPQPVIFTLTPYGSDTYQERASFFSRNGYIFALVDVRGRGNSEGEFSPYVNEPADGSDLVAWFAAQDWCDGQVAMWGGSYAGFNQWVTLKEKPEHLATIVPTASSKPGVDAPYTKNIPVPYRIRWLTYVSGRTPNVNLFNEMPFWEGVFRELYLSQRPFRKLDQIAGNPCKHFHAYLDHPTGHPYWDDLHPSPEQYQQINCPILTITGHLDGNQPGSLSYYREHMQYGRAEVTRQHHLVIGPWDHAGTRQPQLEVGGLHFASHSCLDMNALHKEWYDWVLKKGEKPAFLRKRVAYYVMGAETWKYADDFEQITVETRRLYLDSPHGSAQDVFQSGIMAEQEPSLSQCDQYRYDPLELREESARSLSPGRFLLDQREAMMLTGNGLVYHTRPFEEDVEITGNLNFSACISMDVLDTDFLVMIYEIQPDGTGIVLGRDTLRARFRESLREEKLVETGKINRYIFDGFWFLSKFVKKGSRLRLVLTCPNDIYQQKNYNGGGDVNGECAADAKVAQITLHHTQDFPSYLDLPIGRS